MSDISVLTNYATDSHNITFFQVKVIASHCHAVRQHFHIPVEHQLILEIVYAVDHWFNLHFIFLLFVWRVSEPINIQCLEKCPRLDYKVVHRS